MTTWHTPTPSSWMAVVSVVGPLGKGGSSLFWLGAIFHFAAEAASVSIKIYFLSKNSQVVWGPKITLKVCGGNFSFAHKEWSSILNFSVNNGLFTR